MNLDECKKIVHEKIDEDKSRNWYTIKELQQLTGLDEKQLIEFLSKDKDIIRSNYLSEDNLTRFTTRKDYEQNAPFVKRFLGAFKNRID